MYVNFTRASSPMARPRGTHSESMEEWEDSCVRGVKDRRGIAINKENGERNAAAGEWMGTHTGKIKLCETSRGQQKERKCVCVTEWVSLRETGRGWIAGMR